jgi:hypothetical protein
LLAMRSSRESATSSVDDGYFANDLCSGLDIVPTGDVPIGLVEQRQYGDSRVLPDYSYDPEDQ